MSKAIKALMRDDLKQSYDGVDSACVVSLVGLNANDTHKLRGRLRAKQMRLRVVKNTAARQAFEGGPLAPLGVYLVGPCALVTGGASIVDAAKELVAQARELAGLKLKDGIIEGDRELIPVERIARMKNRDELRAAVAALFTSPARRLAGCLVGPAGLAAACIKAIAEKLEKGETIRPQRATATGGSAGEGESIEPSVEPRIGPPQAD